MVNWIQILLVFKFLDQLQRLGNKFIWVWIYEIQESITCLVIRNVIVLFGGKPFLLWIPFHKQGQFGLNIALWVISFLKQLVVLIPNLFQKCSDVLGELLKELNLHFFGHSMLEGGADVPGFDVDYHELLAVFAVALVLRVVIIIIWI